ncbi:glycolate oxidase subunit GlcF [Methylacidiphilum caldifontis]|uniref:Glycolate oxidase iron-sulfur subunit n=1 Tax=Methylacidiphilum caldifontis TaxID=2795386 RepID=A0A4Y8P9R0_9BACT|nr:glycolate oxidase subunit GlcF [Methylacidiphilum caldifontis]TFE67446.1 glycolate dehydrogenase [Methylacidiphilum caldifontis]
MDTQLGLKFKKESLAIKARELIRACVHCGYCNASCPTYQLLGDELDGPRGRIYLIKSLLEDKTSAEKVKLHLDRCLLCQGCETSCPSSVQFGKLAIIGKEIIEQSVQRSFLERLLLNFFLHFITDRKKFYYLFKFGSSIRALLPDMLRRKLPQVSKEDTILRRDWERKDWGGNPRQMILFKGCVEQVIYPSVLNSARRLFRRVGIELIDVAEEGCCGALAYHLPNRKKALSQMKNNIDVWIAHLKKGMGGIIVCSSACCQMIKEYGDILKDDKQYNHKALQISRMTFDPVEILEKEDIHSLLNAPRLEPVAYHSPCTEQHGLKEKGRVEAFLSRLGIKLTSIPDSHMCCGAAGMYAVMQKELSQRILELKMKNILGGKPAVILTSNVGCRLQLQQLSPVPVLHWLEYIEKISQPAAAQ